MRRFLCPPWTLTLLVASATAIANAESSTKRRSFQQWCEDKAISIEARRTVNELLLNAKTKDCAKAQKILIKHKYIHLGPVFVTEPWTVEPTDPQPVPPNRCGKQGPYSNHACTVEGYALRWRNISDLRPIESFTQAIDIDLSHNKIVDFTTINHLKKAKFISIEHNPIEIKACPFDWLLKDQCRFTPTSK